VSFFAETAEFFSGRILGQIGGFRRAFRLRERIGSGVKAISSYQNLAEAWLAASRTGKWENSESFAALLFEVCEASLPPIHGLLAGMERDVAQEACLMLLGKFLMRNKRLKAATAEGNIEAIAGHLRVSARICIGYATRRLARERCREVAILCPDVDASDIGSTEHFWSRASQFSFEERCAIALAALDFGVRKRLITAKSEIIATLVLKEGLTHRQIAEKLGISPSAVSQQLSRVSARLSILKDAVEVVVR
jgi:DNA-binding CsgD family transcriptional regulator